MKPAKKGELKSILTYHVLPGRYTTQSSRIRFGPMVAKPRSIRLKAKPLTFTEHDGHIRITDEKGDVAEITQGNVMQSNGVIQVINSVLMPS